MPPSFASQCQVGTMTGIESRISALTAPESRPRAMAQESPEAAAALGKSSNAVWLSFSWGRMMAAAAAWSGLRPAAEAAMAKEAGPQLLKVWAR